MFCLVHVVCLDRLFSWTCFVTSCFFLFRIRITVRATTTIDIHTLSAVNDIFYPRSEVHVVILILSLYIYIGYNALCTCRETGMQWAKDSLPYIVGIN